MLQFPPSHSNPSSAQHLSKVLPLEMLAQRWKNSPYFSVLDTNFAEGSLFFQTLNHWWADAHRSQRLDYITVLPEPIHWHRWYHQMAAMPLPSSVLEELERKWVCHLEGYQVIELIDKKVRLLVCVGKKTRLEAVDASVQMVYLHGVEQSGASLAVTMRHVARLCADGAGIITNCIAPSFQQLLRNMGAQIENVVEKSQHPYIIANYLPSYQKRQQRFAYLEKPVQSAVVIGGGIAGLTIAYALAQRGVKVQVLSHRSPNTDHKGAALIPRFSAVDDPLARLSRAGILWAHQQWQQFPNEVFRTSQALWFCKELEREKHLAQQFQKQRFPVNWAEYLSSEQVVEKTVGRLARPAILWHQAAWVHPDKLSQLLLAHENISYQQAEVCKLSAFADEWIIQTTEGKTLAAELCVCANGADIPPLLLRSGLPIPQKVASMQKKYGDITYLASQSALECSAMLAGDHYLLPSDGPFVITGSTFLDNLQEQQVTSRHQMNIEALFRWWNTSQTQYPSIMGGWTGARTFSVDKFPLFGTLQKGLWMVAGYGTRGFSVAALYAQCLVNALWQEALPLERCLLDRLDGQ